MAIFGWLSKLVGGAADGAAVPAEFESDDEPVTDGGRFIVVLHDAGSNRSAVLSVLRVFAPLDENELQLAMENLPYTVREGLTRAAAEAISQRLGSVGAHAGIIESSIGG